MVADPTSTALADIVVMGGAARQDVEEYIYGTPRKDGYLNRLG